MFANLYIIMACMLAPRSDYTACRVDEGPYYGPAPAVLESAPQLAPIQPSEMVLDRPVIVRAGGKDMSYALLPPPLDTLPTQPTPPHAVEDEDVVDALGLLDPSTNGIDTLGLLPSGVATGRPASATEENHIAPTWADVACAPRPEDAPRASLSPLGAAPATTPGLAEHPPSSVQVDKVTHPPCKL